MSAAVLSGFGGLANLSTNVTQVDHTFGWAMLAVAILAGLTGGVLWIMGNDNDQLPPRQSSTGPQSPNIHTEGESSPVNVNYAPPEKAPMPWTVRPGGPRFKQEPAIQGRGDDTWLLAEIYITDASPLPGGLQARWVHSSINMDWVTPPAVNTAVPGAHKWQMKPVPVTLSAPQDTVVLEVQFYLDDGLHGGRWRWLATQHAAKGHWGLNKTAENIFQPPQADTW